jgi:hypothetical protein
MNEQQFAEQIRLALEESTERLPYRVSYRLQSARQAALARLTETREVPESEIALPSASGTLTLGGLPQRERGPARWGRLATGMLSVLVLAGGLFAISEWSEMDRADEAADIDLAVLTDDVPISAYADRGFGVYIKNTQQ